MRGVKDSMRHQTVSFESVILSVIVLRTQAPATAYPKGCHIVGRFDNLNEYMHLQKETDEWKALINVCEGDCQWWQQQC